MSVLVTSISSQGKELDPACGVLSVEVQKELHRIPRAEIRLVDGDAASRRFALSDAAFFQPGKEVEIKLGYAGEAQTSVFKGVVVRHGVEATADSSVLTVELKDRAVKLTRVRRSAVFTDQSDDEVIKKILGDAGVRAGEVASTRPRHAELVQYDATDWDFILSRADVQGLLVAVDGGEVSVKEMKVGGAHDHELRYGIDEMFSASIDVDASRQHEQIEAVGWDLQELARTSPSAAGAVAPSQGDLDGADLARQIGAGTETLVHIAPVSADELDAWANARMKRSRLSMIRGRVALPGRADVKLLQTVKLTSVGKPFDGTALVTAVEHRVEQGQWRTELSLGLDPEWYCHRERIASPPAAGLIPPVGGLQIGVVDEFKDDPDKELRVRVKLPAAGDGVVWARLATPDAGKDRGYFFRPEPGDEVVVGFFNGDPRQPVILGAMFGSKNEPHELVQRVSEKNVKKAIITKRGTTIGFVDDDKASVFIETKDENRILLDDDNQCIEIEDQHGNSIVMNEDGIVIRSAKDLTIQARGKTSIASDLDAEMKSSAAVVIEAPKVDVR